MDGKLYESSFTRTWNYKNWIIEERVMPDGVTKGQSAEKEDFADLEFQVGVQCFYIKITSKIIMRDLLSLLKI